MISVQRSIDQHAAFTYINQNSITAASVQPLIKVNVIMVYPFKLTEDYIEIIRDDSNNNRIKSYTLTNEGHQVSVVTTNVLLSVRVFLQFPI